MYEDLKMNFNMPLLEELDHLFEGNISDLISTFNYFIPYAIYEGFLNVSLDWNWQVIVHFLILYFKIHIVFYGLKYEDLFMPCKLLGSCFYPVYKHLSKYMPQTLAIQSLVDNESLFFDVFNVESQVAMSTCAVLVAVLPLGQFVVDVIFLGTSVWHTMFLYRKHYSKFLVLLLAIFVFHQEKHLIAQGINLYEMFYLVMVFFIVAAFVVREKSNLDLLVLYVILVYFACSPIYSSLREHGIVKTRTYEELQRESFVVRNFVKCLVKVRFLPENADPSEFSWMPMHTAHALSFDLD